MEIELNRYRRKHWGVDGHLLINGKKVCDTVEHPVYKKPAGVYIIDIENNPFRHGNGAMMSSRGEIMVGEYKLPGLVLKSQEVYNRLYERLRKTWQRRKEVRLTIRD